MVIRDSQPPTEPPSRGFLPLALWEPHRPCLPLGGHLSQIGSGSDGAACPIGSGKLCRLQR